MIKKMIKKILLLIFTILFLAGIILIGLGYRMYDDAIRNMSLPEKVSQIQSNPDYTSISELPETYLNAIVAVEDHRFREHFGIDLLAIGRAALNDITSLSLKEGGSTITQQLAKNLYFTQEKSFIRKIAEVFMALRLEKEYEKDEILELYVNSIYFGDGYYCVKAASVGYFGKIPMDMSDYESTLLAGIPNAPSVYSLTVNPELTAQRQQYVLEQMKKYGYLSETEENNILMEKNAAVVSKLHSIEGIEKKRNNTFLFLLFRI